MNNNASIMYLTECHVIKLWGDTCHAYAVPNVSVITNNMEWDHPRDIALEIYGEITTTLNETLRIRRIASEHLPKLRQECLKYVSVYLEKFPSANEHERQVAGELNDIISGQYEKREIESYFHWMDWQDNQSHLLYPL